MAAYTTEALILRARDFGEADRLLTLYTLAEGKVSAKVRGARKPKSRLSGATLPLTQAEVMLWRGRSSIETLTQAVSKEGFGPLREDLWRLAQGNLVAELVDLTTEERVPSPETYVALLQTMTLVAYGEAPEVAAYSFGLRLLRDAGLLSQLGRCASCGRELPEERATEGEAAVWPRAAEGPLCRACAAAAGVAGLSLGPDVLRVLSRLLDAGPRALAALRLSAQLEAQIRAVLWDALTGHLERRPRSLEFVDIVAATRAARAVGGGGQDGTVRAP
ncbi:MAG: DNA repair protein RecO [Bacillota bacterium]|nr:DNA repair protein RecO [Bacillota bacterium]